MGVCPVSVMSKLKQLRVAVSDRRWWPFYFQRLFMTRSARARVARWIARRRPQAGTNARAAPRTSELTGLLCSDGFALLGKLLSDADCRAAHEYLTKCVVHDPYRPGAGTFLPLSDRRPDASHIAHHDARDVLLAPGLLALANSEQIIAVAECFLGCRATISYLAAWWSYPTKVGAQHAEHFHRDVDDWRFLKLFVYLTDVGEEQGPHKYVAGSAANDQLREIRRFTDGEVEAVFGRARIAVMTGRAGDAFLEDTFGIHKGQPVVTGRRLIFQAVYSLSELPYGPSSPVATNTEVARVTAPTTLDPWVNRCYVKS